MTMTTLTALGLIGDFVILVVGIVALEILKGNADKIEKLIDKKIDG